METDEAQTEREREVQILKVCLAEIERSRPFLLVLLGDRFGWVPSSDRSKAATEEAGMTDVEGKSVTALEIEFGLLQKRPDQRRRSLLCLREPLPYDRMDPRVAAVFAEAYSPVDGALERAHRLADLKSRLLADSELAAHCFRYRLDWNLPAARPEKDSLEAWAAAVQERLWVQIDEETRDRIGAPEPTWQQEEADAIEEMVERLNHCFVGRADLVAGALALATSPSVANAPWGLCLTGGSGCGKSALFARLHHELNRRQDLLLLTHAAGLTPRSGQTGDMLRRWIRELAAALGEVPPDLPMELKPEVIERQFALRLHRAANSRRIVVLVDALNHILRTDRSRTVSWLPIFWPDNARFLATSVAGDETERLAGRPGLTLAAVPPLSAAEADAISVHIYGRYHRTPNAGLMTALMSKRLPDGTPAADNPLWLILALDLLNLLDADDLTQAEAAIGGAPAEKLLRHLRTRVDAFPPSVEDLYGYLLRHIEKVVGVGETRAFVSLLALSRHGWREGDLNILIPRAAGILIPPGEVLLSFPKPLREPSKASEQSDSGDHPFNADHLSSFDPLRFAILRRLFRIHLAKRGALEQWDFTHTPLRTAVRSLLDTAWRPAGAGDIVPALYALGASYLQSLPKAAPPRPAEIMWQMLGTRDALRVATHYAQPEAYFDLLPEYLIEDAATSTQSLKTFVLSLISVDGPAGSIVEAMFTRFFTPLHDSLAKEGFLSLRAELIHAATGAIAGLAAAKPANPELQRKLCWSLRRQGDIAKESGEPVAAAQYYTQALRIAESLSKTESDDTDSASEVASPATIVLVLLPSNREI